MNRIFLISGIAITLLVVLFIIIDEPLPQGQEGPEAERLADRMLAAVNYAAWDSTVAVKWSFRGHHYLWDKKRQLVQVRWNDKCVLLNTSELVGTAFENSRKLESQQSEKALQTAWKYFVNDAFWLAAPFKIRDPGTIRTLVTTGRGDALLVHYTSGGVTPGDSYLWILDKDGTPRAWKLWVQVLPVGGLEFSWENWQTYSTGAQLASFHNGIVDIEVSGIQLSMDVASLNNGVDPFKDM